MLTCNLFTIAKFVVVLC